MWCDTTEVHWSRLLRTSIGVGWWARARVLLQGSMVVWAGACASSSVSFFWKEWTTHLLTGCTLVWTLVLLRVLCAPFFCPSWILCRSFKLQRFLRFNRYCADALLHVFGACFDLTFPPRDSSDVGLIIRIPPVVLWSFLVSFLQKIMLTVNINWFKAEAGFDDQRELRSCSHLNPVDVLWLRITACAPSCKWIFYLSDS